MGYRIELEEIEHVLMKLPQVSQAALLYHRANTAYGKLIGYVACTESEEEKVLLVALANLLFLPIGSKLKSKTTDEVVTYEMIVEGVLSIQAGETPRIVEMKMTAFLPPKLREKTAAESDKRELRRAA